MAEEKVAKETTEKDSQDKETKPVESKPKEITQASLIHIDTFLATAKVIYNLNTLQIAGFKAYMTGKFYQNKDEDFVPYLNKYLGKGE